MKKKPEATEDEATFLTDAEIDQLAAAVHATTQNIFRAAERMFPGRKFRDKDWDRLERIGKVFKCDECNEFLTTDCKAVGFESCCESCAGEQSEDYDDEA